MKTFETEKHNIPEGATHYRNECNKRHFLWVKVDGDDVTVYIDSEGEFLSANWLKGGRYIGSVKPIPQTSIETPEEKEVEWVNGDECISSTGYKFTFIGLCNYSRFDCILLSDMGVTTFGFVKELSRPETKQQREERERLESAHDLYCYVNSTQNKLSCTYSWFLEESMKNDRERFLAIVDKTNYRKESEL